jgi:hypothetical protein
VIIGVVRGCLGGSSRSQRRHVHHLTSTRAVAPCLKCPHSRHLRKRGERLELAQLSDQHQAEPKELIDAQPRLMDCAGREPLPSMCIVPLSQPGDARLARDYQAAG